MTYFLYHLRNLKRFQYVIQISTRFNKYNCSFARYIYFIAFIIRNKVFLSCEKYTDYNIFSISFEKYYQVFNVIQISICFNKYNCAVWRIHTPSYSSFATRFFVAVEKYAGRFIFHIHSVEQDNLEWKLWIFSILFGKYYQFKCTFEPTNISTQSYFSYATRDFDKIYINK